LNIGSVEDAKKGDQQNVKDDGDCQCLKKYAPILLPAALVFGIGQRSSSILPRARTAIIS
jgi:hypothetical protein